MYINGVICLTILFRIRMDISGNPPSIDRLYELQLRRMRLIEDVLEDYQLNIRHALRLISSDLAFSNNIATPTERLFDRFRNPQENYINQYYRHLSRPSLHRNPPVIERREPEIPIVYIDPPLPGLTDAEIAAETQTVQYDASMNIDRCPITWDRFVEGQNVMRINRCGHFFDENAIIEWFLTHDSCPVCRTSLTGTGAGTIVNGNTHVGNTVVGNNRAQYNTANNAVNQLMATFITSVNNAINSNSYYESEVVLDMNDLLSIYNNVPSSRN